MSIIEARGEYIFIKYDEYFSKSHITDLMKAVKKEASELGCYKLLGDISNMQGTVSIMDRFEFGVQGANMFRDKYKIAIVYRAEEINRFAENVSVNRGLNARVFSKKEKALEWLLKKD